MKDSEARDSIEALEQRVHDLEASEKARTDVLIQYCPKCKHDTAQKALGSLYRWTVTVPDDFPHFKEKSTRGDYFGYSRCLTCGTKLERNSETTIIIAKEEKC